MTIQASELSRVEGLIHLLSQEGLIEGNGPKIERTTPLADLGIDSIHLVQLAIALEERGISIADCDISVMATVGSIVDYCAERLA